jgi:hypothetical protein
MYRNLFFLSLLSGAFAARPFWNEVHTGYVMIYSRLTPLDVLTCNSLEEFLGPSYPKGQLPDLEDIWDLHDFEYAARNTLNGTSYSWYRHASGGEYTYRNNMEVFPRIGFRPRVLQGAPKKNVNME